jgi:hypothetical protein
MEAVIFHEMLPIKYRDKCGEVLPSKEQRDRMVDGELWVDGYVASKTIHGAYTVISECGYSSLKKHEDLKFL